MTDKRASPLALLALFLSGAAGLIDQVAWVRRASLTFGSTTHALSTVLAVFFLGLALGGWVFGRRSGRIRRPLVAAALLELVLAGFVLATPWGFDAVEGLYGQAYRAVGAADSDALLWGARAGLVALVLLPAAFLMGGTLPLFARQVVADRERIGASVAGIYALNTLGAAVGCALAGFVLVPALGLTGTLASAAGLNVIAAFLLWTTRAPALEPVPDLLPVEERVVASRLARWVVAAVLFATGFVALAQEVVWARFLAALVGNGIHTVSLTLTIVLVGIVLGSALVSRLADHGWARGRTLGLFQIAGAILFWTPFFLPPAWWRGWAGEGSAAAVLMLPAAILAGASFPLAVRLVVSRPEWAGLRLGTLLAANTLGGIAGALVTGFLLLPRSGIVGGAATCTFLSLIAGAAAWGLLETGGRSWARNLVFSGAIGLVVLVPLATRVKVPDDALAEPARRIAVKEGLESNLAVVRGAAGERVLEIDRMWQGQDVKTHQVMAAHLPMLLHPDPRHVLLVGVGAGQTPARFVLYDGLARLDCADIEPAVFAVVREHFEHAWMDDPRVRLLPVDGRNHLTHTGERYDVISLEVGQLFRPGAASFYTRDFYERARARLRPGGIVSQFVPIPFLRPEDLRTVVATFRDVFPEATLWYNTSELLLVGAAERAVTLEPARVAAALADPAIASDLSFSLYGGRDRWHVRPEVLHGAFLVGPGGLAALARGARIERDDRPRLAYAVTRPAAGEEPREIAALALLRRHVEPITAGSPGLAESAVAEAGRVREDNLREVVASVLLRQVEGARAAHDLPRMTVLLRQAVAAHPGNVKAHRMLADALLLQGRTEESERHYQAALAITDLDARTHGGYALWLLTQSRFAESAGHFRHALALGPDDADWRNNLGAALVRLGDLPGAVEEFRRALELNPSMADARQNYEATRAVVEQRARRPSPFTSDTTRAAGG
jgi:spermidine synthase